MATTLKPPSRATAERASGPPQKRSLAMYLVIAGLTVQLASFVWFLVLAALTGHATDSIVLPLYVFVAAFLALTALALRRPRPWVYLTGGLSLVVLCLLYIPFLFPGLFQPISDDARTSWASLVILPTALVGGIAGILAFRQGRGRQWTPAGRSARSELAAAAFAGLLIGAVYVSVTGSLAPSTASGVKNGVQEAPTQPALVITAQNTRFDKTTLQAQAGALAIYAVNKDSSAHTFDIDIGGSHYSYTLAANSSTGVLLKIPGAGTYTYYCAIPGHRPPMEGTLQVS